MRFIDSLNFTATSLTQMPAMFGLDTSTYKKGYFPYLMNAEQYQDYVGAMPPLSCPSLTR